MKEAMHASGLCALDSHSGLMTTQLLWPSTQSDLISPKGDVFDGHSVMCALCGDYFLFEVQCQLAIRFLACQIWCFAPLLGRGGRDMISTHFQEHCWTRCNRSSPSLLCINRVGFSLCPQIWLEHLSLHELRTLDSEMEGSGSDNPSECHFSMINCIDAFRLMPCKRLF